MGSWKDNNLSGILEYPFDIDRYVKERLREIEDVKEREFAKVILVDGMSRIIDVTEAKYKQLEFQVYEDFEIETNYYMTAMTIVERNCYDPTNHTLYPLIEADLSETDLKQLLSTEIEVWIGTVYMEMDEGSIRNFKNSVYISGLVKTNGANGGFYYQVRPAARYRRIIETLYQMFLDNHVTWETIHTGYLDKFFDVYVILDGEFEKTIVGPGKKRREQFLQNLFLQDMELPFGDFERYVRYDMVPLWNIKWISFKNESFIVPCVDGIYYEHTFQPVKQSLKAGYLIQNNKDIVAISHEKARVVIKSTKENFDNWNVACIIQAEIVQSQGYTAPFLTNRKRDSFVRRYAERKGTRLLTKAELFRKITEMHVQDYIEAVDYEIKDSVGEDTIIGMNWFVSDEVFPMGSRRILIFRFKEKQPGHYLNDSMVRFVISQMQLEINEYRLLGKII